MTATGKCYPYLRVIVEIRINSQSCKGINLTTWHTWVKRAPRVATVHNAVKETIKAHLTLVHVFHAYASMNTPWVAHALFHFTPVRYGRIASDSAAHKATQFVRPHKILYTPVHNSNLLIGARRSILNWHMRGLPHWSSEFQIIPLILIPIQYSPLSPICPTRSLIIPIIRSSC
jgi:hypothetical protein